MELWQYYRILRKRKWLIIIGTLICVGLVMGITLLRPQSWDAYTTVMEKLPSNTEVSIFNSPYYMQVDPQMRVANLSRIVMSQTVMQRSVETLYRLGIVKKPETIVQTLDVTPVGNTTHLRLKVRSTTPEDAEATVNVITAEFIKFYDEMNYGGATRTRQFIKRELPKAEKRLADAREASRAFKESAGVVNLSSQTTELIQRISQLKYNLSQSQILAEQTRARKEALGSQLADSKKYPEIRDAQTTIATNPVWQQLETQLASQEIDLQRMLKSRREAHPDVAALEKAIEKTKSKMKEAGVTALSSSSKGPNPVYDTLLQNYVSASADYSAAASASRAAEAEIAAIEPQTKAIPEEEAKLAQLTLEEDAAQNTYTLLRQKLDEATIKEQEAESGSLIQVIDQAQSIPSDTQKTMKLILALLLSPILCSGIAFLLNYMDNTIKTPAEAEALLKLPVFAVVPTAKSSALADDKHVPAVIGASYQMLSTNLWINHDAMEGRTVLIASAESDVGRSTTAANLAISLARDGARVILVDSDLRQPTQHLFFGAGNETGFSNVLAGKLPLKDALQPTSVTDLLLITSGPLPANPVRLLRSSEMVRFVKEINDLADFVIFDSPSGAAFADATLLAALVRNVVIVHAAGTVPRGAESEFSTRLEQVDANVLGAVLNMAKPEDSHGYYHFKMGYEDAIRDAKRLANLPGGRSQDTSAASGRETDATDRTDA